MNPGRFETVGALRDQKKTVEAETFKIDSYRAHKNPEGKIALVDGLGKPLSGYYKELAHPICKFQTDLWIATLDNGNKRLLQWNADRSSLVQASLFEFPKIEADAEGRLVGISEDDSKQMFVENDSGMLHVTSYQE